jgi:hypothetical protein
MMKAKKVLKRVAKIEALMLKVTEQSSSDIRELLRDAKAAVIRAKEAVQASFETAKNPPVKYSKPTSRATPESSKSKRKISVALHTELGHQGSGVCVVAE